MRPVAGLIAAIVAVGATLSMCDDAQAQKSGGNYTGIAGIHAQDQAVTESMGPIYDRTQEHLGTTDAMVIRVRRRLIDICIRRHQLGIGESNDSVGRGAGCDLFGRVSSAPCSQRIILRNRGKSCKQARHSGGVFSDRAAPRATNTTSCGTHSTTRCGATLPSPPDFGLVRNSQ